MPLTNTSSLLFFVGSVLMLIGAAWTAYLMFTGVFTIMTEWGPALVYASMSSKVLSILALINSIALVLGLLMKLTSASEAPYSRVIWPALGCLIFTIAAIWGYNIWGSLSTILVFMGFVIIVIGIFLTKAAGVMPRIPSLTRAPAY
ncbi:MAG: hypothetical protein ACXQTU_04910 [Candidatus Nezhaarchaeales archaeon]